jgi:hypothetical protein
MSERLLHYSVQTTPNVVHTYLIEFSYWLISKEIKTTSTSQSASQSAGGPNAYRFIRLVVISYIRYTENTIIHGHFYPSSSFVSVVLRVPRSCFITPLKTPSSRITSIIQWFWSRVNKSFSLFFCISRIFLNNNRMPIQNTQRHKAGMHNKFQRQ